MRKKTVNHVADTIFWYLLYFLPIISYLLFCFTEPTRVEQLDFITETETVSTMSLDSYSLDVTIGNSISSGYYIFDESLNMTMFSTNGYSLSVDFLSNNNSYTYMLITSNFDLYFENDLVYRSGSWIDTSYMVIELLDTYTANSPDLFYFLQINLTSYTPVVPDIPIEPTLNIVPFYDYMISTYQFTDNNFIYTVIVDIFGESGVFNLALDKGIYLYFSWFIGVYLMHLFVDFILFIPRLCHKWLKEFTQGD